METYRVREVKFIYVDDGILLKPLREYERQSSDRAGLIQQVQHFFEMELSSAKALETVDFDAVVIIDPTGDEIARFSVADFWRQEWIDVASDGDTTAPIAPNAAR